MPVKTKPKPKKQRLTEIPEPKPRPAKLGKTAADPAAPPSLDHIAPDLRGMAVSTADSRVHGWQSQGSRREEPRRYSRKPA